jgi:K+-transporting ATPase KdpF subunit
MRIPMTTGLFVGLLTAVGLLVYLFVALLQPERF